MAQLISRFADFLRTATTADIDCELASPDRLSLAVGVHRARRLDVVWAPFDHVNPAARVVIVGLTPGRQQARAALIEAASRLRAGASEAEALEAAKVHASFAGPMRANLVAMLDAVGLARRLGLSTTAALWGEAVGLVQFTSALRHPVFVVGANYGGAPAITTTPFLRDQLLRWFAPEMAALPDAVFVPLGPKVADALHLAAREAGVAPERILDGLQHPSGANAERIAFFLGCKQRAALSAKTDPDKVLAGRRAIESRLAALVEEAA